MASDKLLTRPLMADDDTVRGLNYRQTLEDLRNIVAGRIQCPDVVTSVAAVGGTSYALTFDGTGHGTAAAEYATTGTVSAGTMDLTTAYTVMAWVLPASGITTRTLNIVATVSGSSMATHRLIFSVNNARGLDIWHNGTRYIMTAGTVTTGAWNHIAIRWDGATISAYVNGGAAGTGSTSATLTATPHGLTMGGNWTGTVSNWPWEGQIEQLAVFNTDKGASYISSIYNSGSGDNIDTAEAGLVALYRCDEGSGTTVGDSTGTTGHDMAMNNMESGDWYSPGKVSALGSITATPTATDTHVRVQHAACTVTLPAVASVQNGKDLFVKCEVTSPNCTLSGDIDGTASTTVVLDRDYAGAHLRKVGSYWWILSSDKLWGLT